MSGQAGYHTHAAIISTGDEIALGEALNTNSRWIAEWLMDRGIQAVEHVTLGDDRGATAAAIKRLVERVSLVISTGGLGPTDDDCTREALADVLGEELVLDKRALRRLEARFRLRGRAMTDNQRRQAMRPASALCLDNDNGTAPGLHAVVRATGPHGSSDVFCLPGPPREMKPMVEAAVLTRLRLDPRRVVRTRLLHTIGLGEGDVAARLGGLLARGREPQVGITVTDAVVTLRVRSLRATDAAAAEAAVARDESAIRAELGVHVFGADADTLAGVVVRHLAVRGRALAVVESCTGGLLAEQITQVSGSSEVFRGGWVTYSNQMKMSEVGVPRETLEAHGAVSAETARAMAVGGLERAWRMDPQSEVNGEVSATSDGASGQNGRHCLAITGIAGPSGGSPAKPVGTVFVAHAWQAGASAPAPAVRVDVRRLLIAGDREDVQIRSARTALAMLYFSLQAESQAGATIIDAGKPATPRLLWEIGREGGTGAR